jgi:superfamily II DNA/RNA helicase
VLFRSRQTLFFSATMPPEIKRLADQFLMNPKEVTVAPPASPAETVAQALVRVAERDKRAALRHLLRAEDVRNALVFCNRKKDVQILQRSLKKHGFNAGALHGDMHQSERMETLDAFRKGDITILVCSDVAARGLDIAFLSHVFNFDVPIHAEDYVHRIGRTGRAGREGKAFMLATSDDGKFLSAIERLIGRPIPKVELEGLETGGDEDEGRGERGDRRHGRDRHAGERQSRGRGERRERPERARDHETPAEHGQADQAAEPLAAAAASVPAEPQQPYRGQPKPPQGERERNTRDRQGRVRNEPPVKLAVDNDRHRGRGRRRDRDDDDPPVVGLGDHVPAFLLRAPRRGGVGA